MTTIRVGANESIASIERHLRVVHANADGVDIRLPSKVTEQIGVDAALLQLLMTWSQHQQAPLLRTYVDTRKSAPEMIDTLCKRVVGVTAVTLSRTIESVDHMDIRADAWKAASAQVQRMTDDKAHFQRGTSYAVLCFDGTTMAYPRNLYHPTRQVRSLVEFERLFRGVLERTETLRVRRERIEEVVMRLGAILFETFRNTDQWARTTVDGVPISRSVRGLLVRRYREPSAELANRHQADAPLFDFLTNHLDPHDGTRVGVLELSVFDGGPGLVRRYLNTDDIDSLSLDEERAACVECFDKHKTSAGMPHRGVGLQAAMRELSRLGGMLRLRTGRLSLYRNFAQDPLEEGHVARFLDWPSETECPDRADVAGLVLTFVLPIPEEDIS